jgi:hypothetical protein
VKKIQNGPIGLTVKIGNMLRVIIGVTALAVAVATVYLIGRFITFLMLGAAYKAREGARRIEVWVWKEAWHESGKATEECFQIGVGATVAIIGIIALGWVIGALVIGF